jgi:hypothetical protein
MAPDGSVWVQAYEAVAAALPSESRPIHLYVITPEAVEAST